MIVMGCMQVCVLNRNQKCVSLFHEFQIKQGVTI